MGVIAKVILFLLMAVSCGAAHRRDLIAPVPLSGNGGDPSGTNTLKYLWVSSDVSSNVTVTEWTDRIVSAQWTNSSTDSPTNTADGMTMNYSTSGGATIAPNNAGGVFTIADSATVFIIFKPYDPGNGYQHLLLDTYVAPYTGLWVQGSKVRWANGGFTDASDAYLSANTISDFCQVQSNSGPVMFTYTNGFLSKTITDTAPAGGWKWHFLMHGSGSDYSYKGGIYEIRMYSNILTSLQISNLHHYRTNIYGGSP